MGIDFVKHYPTIASKGKWSGVNEVEVFESGIGAINVPLLAGMVGSRPTTGCHPEFFRLMSRLASLVAARDITFRLPFFSRTRGEMVRAINDTGLADLASIDHLLRSISEGAQTL